MTPRPRIDRERREGKAIVRGAAVHLVAVAAAWAAFATFGERWHRLAILMYLPRAIFLLPSLVLVPALVRARRRRWLWAQAAALALVLGPLMGLHLGRQRQGRRDLRVLSWQVWYGMGETRALSQAIAAYQPDLVLFEANGPDTTAVLRRSGFAQVVALDQFAAASRWPLRAVAQGAWVDEVFHRPWVRFEVSAPFGALQAVAVHARSPRRTIDLRQPKLWRRTLLHGESEDLEMVDDQLGVLDGELRAAGPLSLAAGDFNAGDGGALLSGRFEGFADAFAATGLGYGYTFPTSHHLLPWIRLDRVYSGPRLVPLRTEVLTAPASDHAGLLTDFSVRP